jgi:hypothetical protein
MNNFTQPRVHRSGAAFLSPIQIIKLIFRGTFMTAAHADAILYTPADVFRATGISVPKQNQWYDRRTIKPSRIDKKPSGSGSYRLVCAGTVHRFGITAACVNVGMSAKHSADAASLLADEQTGRPAGKLFEYGRTLLITNACGSRIVNCGFNDALFDICGRPFQAAVVVDVGQIVAAVDSILMKVPK